MSDKIEKYIRNNRQEFDDQLPRRDVFSSVVSDLQETAKDQKSRTLPVIRIITGIAAALVIGFMLWFLNMNSNSVNDRANQINQPAGFQEVEMYYASMIEQKKAVLRNELGHDHPLYQEFTQDLDRLDSLYTELKSDYREALDNEAVLDAMTQNLQARIAILNEQLEILNRIKNTPNETIL